MFLFVVVCAVYFVYANATRIHATLCAVSRVEESLNIFESSALNIYLQRRLSIYLMNIQKNTNLTVFSTTTYQLNEQRRETRS